MRATRPRPSPHSKGRTARRRKGAKPMPDKAVRLPFLAGFAALCMSAVLCATAARAGAPEPADPWPDLVRDVFDNRPLAEGTGVVAIEMPARAEDAAIVPVVLRLAPPPDDGRTVKAVTLVIDQNPAPVAAKFEGGAGVGVISTRGGGDSYTQGHAVAGRRDGSLPARKNIVKS